MDDTCFFLWLSSMDLIGWMVLIIIMSNFVLIDIVVSGYCGSSHIKPNAQLMQELYIRIFIANRRGTDGELSKNRTFCFIVEHGLNTVKFNFAWLWLFFLQAPASISSTASPFGSTETFAASLQRRPWQQFSQPTRPGSKSRAPIGAPPTISWGWLAAPPTSLHLDVLWTGALTMATCT
jgi:hypothetical protein